MLTLDAGLYIFLIFTSPCSEQNGYSFLFFFPVPCKDDMEFYVYNMIMFILQLWTSDAQTDDQQEDN